MYLFFIIMNHLVGNIYDIERLSKCLTYLIDQVSSKPDYTINLNGYVQMTLFRDNKTWNVVLKRRQDNCILFKKQIELQCLCDGASFSFPLGDCVLLPLKNSTVEELSAYVAQRIVKSVGARLLECGVHSLTCGVAELDGQEARSTLRLTT